MNNQTDLAWVSLQTGKTEFTEGIHTFNGCEVTISKREDPYGFVNGNCRNCTMSARYWGVIVFPNGTEKYFAEERGGAIARSTGFSVKTERALYKEQGDKYILPYQR